MNQFERDMKLNYARHKLLAVSLHDAAGWFEKGKPLLDKLDAAAIELADALREPTTCEGCGQEVPHHAADPR